MALGLAGLLIASGATANVRRFAVMFLAVPVASFVMWTFFYGYGQSAAGLAPPSRAEAIEFAAGMALKLESFLAASVLFLSITRVEEFTEALRALGMPYRMSFAGASKHVRVLENAGLVTRTVRGRTHLCRLEAARLAEANAWLRRYERFWNAKLDALEALLLEEDKAKAKKVQKR